MATALRSTSEVAAKFFSSFLYLDKPINKLAEEETARLFKDVEKVISFFIIANNPGIWEVTLEQTQLKSYLNLEVELQPFRDGIKDILSLGLAESNSRHLILTEKGRELHSFMHNKRRVDAWLKRMQCQKGACCTNEESIDAVRKMIDSEERINKAYRPLEFAPESIALELANRMFEGVIYLKIGNERMNEINLEKFVSLFILANVPEMKLDRLEEVQIDSVQSPFMGYSYHQFKKGLEELEKFGVISCYGDSVSLTKAGRLVYNFIHDNEKVSKWLGNMRYTEKDQIQGASNVKKIRQIIDSELPILKNLGIKPEIARLSRGSD